MIVVAILGSYGLVMIGVTALAAHFNEKDAEEAAQLAGEALRRLHDPGCPERGGRQAGGGPYRTGQCRRCGSPT